MNKMHKIGEDSQIPLVKIGNMSTIREMILLDRIQILKDVM